MTDNTTTLLSVTATRARLRAAKRAIEAIDRDWPSHGRHEVQTRIIPGYAATLDEARAVAARSGDHGDDLDSFVSWDRAPRHPQFRRPGAIVHIVSSDTFGLFDVRMVWLGYGPDDVPVVVDRRAGDRGTA